MNKDYANAFSCVESLMKFHEEQGESQKGQQIKPYEISEILMLGVRSLQKLEKFTEALEFLAKRDKQILNQPAKHKVKGELLQSLGKTKEAIEEFEELLQLNSNNFDTYYAILGAKGINLPEDKSLVSKT